MSLRRTRKVIAAVVIVALAAPACSDSYLIVVENPCAVDMTVQFQVVHSGRPGPIDTRVAPADGVVEYGNPVGLPGAIVTVAVPDLGWAVEWADPAVGETRTFQIDAALCR